MKQFCDEDFLLENLTAKKLYNWAKGMPILDYHNHLVVKELADNIAIPNLTELWLKADHYKWRQMRTCGVSEEFVTGNASDWDKYLKWVECCELLIGNPLTQWCQLELKIYFNITKPLILKNAKEIWDKANEKLAKMTCRSFLEKSNVYAICTTDDPIDNLEYHQKLKKDWKYVKVIGNFRPDKVMKINHDGFNDYIGKLSSVSQMDVKDYDSLIQALEKRIEFFDQMGGKSADHGLDELQFIPTTPVEANKIVKKRLSGEKLTDEEFHKFISALLLDLARIYKKFNWAMLWHINCLRDNNKQLLKTAGENIGCDSTAEGFLAKPLNQILGILKEEGNLGKLSIFSLNPNNWDAIATLVGNYQNNEEGIKGMIQLGTAWWFADTFTGNVAQIQKFAELSTLGTNIGMLTDSRAYPSFARHDYYRRLLCNIIGDWVEKGMCVNDDNILKKLIEGISFANAKVYFGY